MWDCELYDYTDHILLLTTRKHPSVIVKLQKDPKKQFVADETANEAAIYKTPRQKVLFLNTMESACILVLQWLVWRENWMILKILVLQMCQ